MLEGVTVLAAAEVSSWAMEWALATGILGIALFIIAIVIGVNNGRADIPGEFIVLSIIMLGMCLAFMAIDKTEYHGIEYKVTIDDSVSFNEFAEHYDIISQDGSIFIVREKE